MVKAKFSNNYWAVVKRIQRLPKLANYWADTITRKDAEGLIEEYQKGIRDNSFRLIPLKLKTILQKEHKGYSKPRTPLYGKGDEDKNSLINAFRIRKIKKGYTVYLSNAKHHESQLKLKWLFFVHEKGALIEYTNKKGNKVVIRIPPRPTRLKAFKRFLARKLRQENVKKARQEIIRYLRTGNKGKRNEASNRQSQFYD